MNDFRDLKAIAEACQRHQPLRFMRSHGALYIRNDNGIVFDVHQNRSFPEFMAQNKDYADLALAANPETILALIAENERLKNRLEVDPRHDYDGISTRDATVKVLDEQVDQLKADNERLRADYARLARFNPEWDRVAAAQDLVREHMAMVVQLKAEIAGLKTGYEAYEQVNAELKAEVEALRRVTGNRYAPPRAPLTGPSKCLSCGEIHYGMGGLPCPNMRITAQADLPETLSGQIGAALGQGELS